MTDRGPETEEEADLEAATIGIDAGLHGVLSLLLGIARTARETPGAMLYLRDNIEMMREIRRHATEIVRMSIHGSREEENAD